MTTSLVFYGILGLASTALAFGCNRRLFVAGGAGRVSLLEGVFYFVGVVSLLPRLVLQRAATSTTIRTRRATSTTRRRSSRTGRRTRRPRTTSCVNVVLLPLWTIVDGRRRSLRIPWIFFVMSLFTSLAFSMAFYLAFVERQIRYNRDESAASSTA